MQSLNNFTNFELNTEEKTNVNGGLGNRLGRGRIHGRFGKENIQFIYGTKMSISNTFADYASFDFAGFEKETTTTKETTTQPEFTSDQLDPEQIIL